MAILNFQMAYFTYASAVWQMVSLYWLFTAFTAGFCGAHLDTPTIAEVSCSLSLRGTSGERAGGEGLVPSNCRALLNPLSLTLSPLLRRGERESAAGVVVVSRCAPTRAKMASSLVMNNRVDNHT